MHISISTGATTPDAVLLVGSFAHVWALQSLFSTGLFSNDTRGRIALFFLAFVFFRAHALTSENRTLRAQLHNVRSLQSRQATPPTQISEPIPTGDAKISRSPEPETDEMRALRLRRKPVPGEGRPNDQAVVVELKRRWDAGEGSGSGSGEEGEALIAGGSGPEQSKSKAGESAIESEQGSRRPRSPPPPPPPRRRVDAQDIWVPGSSSRKA
ncbi:hypothetical protein FIBSPDRAFT_847855 [Athelia psychrophila]|uniref:Uncharacterized protein n=1 Tax=Athelia psychrophila TaxID=1759441 RepID=A0A166W028_9AGAM|nr:hypothetical protein FIBSPDRAFT_847855 [Fibularhizoctonia sp. CBS 109695]